MVSSFSGVWWRGNCIPENRTRGLRGLTGCLERGEKADGWISRVLNSFCDAFSRAPQLGWRWRGTFTIDVSLACLRTPALTVGSPEGLVEGGFGPLEAGSVAWVKRFLECSLFGGFSAEG